MAQTKLKNLYYVDGILVEAALRNRGFYEVTVVKTGYKMTVSTKIFHQNAVPVKVNDDDIRCSE